MHLTDAQIEAGRSIHGGWTRKQLAAWGVSWPPPKGWRKRLTSENSQRVPFQLPVRPIHYKMKTKASNFPHIPLARFYFRKPFQSSTLA
jgi:hypothetical protein